MHRISSPRASHTKEGGFALAQTETDFSGIRALEAGAVRQGCVALPAPNTNLMFPRSMVPQLSGGIESGKTVFGSAILASPDIWSALDFWENRPALPDLKELERLCEGAEPVAGWAGENDPDNL